MSKKFYFTFGSSEKFPWQNTYMVIISSDYWDAVDAFRKKYPDINENCLNCSDYYSEEEWRKNCSAFYKDAKPSEILFTEKCFGEKPKGYADLFVFVPEMGEIVCISEGTGENLLSEDIADGYVDYINFSQYDLSVPIKEIDGGRVMTKRMVKDQYGCLADSIPDVMAMAYGDRLIDCMILL